MGGLFLANACFGIMTQADVILVKHCFPEQDAGLYASAAIMGKAVMYLPGALVLALFPMVAANQATGRSSLGILVKAMGLTLALSGFGALILYLFPEILMGVLFGERYLPAAPVTALFGLAMLPMAGILVLMNFLLAQGKTRFVIFLGAGALLELVGIHFFRTDLLSVLYVILTAGAAAFLCMALLVILSRPKTNPKDQTGSAIFDRTNYKGGNVMPKSFILEYWVDDDWYVGRIQEVPGVFSQGQTIEELKENIRDAYRMAMQESQLPGHPESEQTNKHPPFAFLAPSRFKYGCPANHAKISLTRGLSGITLVET